MRPFYALFIIGVAAVAIMFGVILFTLIWDARINLVLKGIALTLCWAEVIAIVAIAYNLMEVLVL